MAKVSSKTLLSFDLFRNNSVLVTALEEGAARPRPGRGSSGGLRPRCGASKSPCGMPTSGSGRATSTSS